MPVDHKTTDGQIQAHLKAKYGMDTPQPTICKARQAIVGSDAEAQVHEFQQIEAWLKAVKTADPQAHTAHLPEEGKFARAFICPGAARVAWNACKPFVAVDGTWTKNRHGMVLLLAATMDADSNLIILAWAIVRNETQVTWERFLRMLLYAIPDIGESHTTIISDRQKGLLAAVKEVLPDTTEGYCCWHLAENIKTHFGATARQIFWRLVYAETKDKFNSCMDEMKAHKPEAAQYLADTEIPHKHWASYAFPGRRFDHVTSNLSEIANSALRLHRELPPLQLMVAIYNYEMRNFFERLKAATEWKQVLARHPHELFVSALKDSKRMRVVAASDRAGLVTGSTGNQYTVLLAEDPTKTHSSCTCGVPNLMLLPCAHLCAFAAAVKKPAVQYSHALWRTSAWRHTYSVPYVPVSSDNLASNDLSPPDYRVKKGRPQKERKEAGKGPSSTPHPSNTQPAPSFCRKCGEASHTAKQCHTFHGQS